MKERRLPLSRNSLRALHGLRERFLAALPVPLLALLAAYIGIRSLFWDTYPIWDGMVLYYSILNAYDHPFDLLNYSSDGHLCQGFYLFMQPFWWWFGRNFVRFNIWLTIFSCLSIIAFYHLLRRFTRCPPGAWETAAATALFAFHPTILSNMVQFNLDMGVVTFLLLYWLALAHGRKFTAAGFAALTLFSKEPAILLLPLPFLFCLLSQERGQRLRWCIRHAIVLAVPYLMLVALLYYKVMVRGQPAFWVNGIIAQPDMLPAVLNLFSLSDLQKEAFVMIAMNFQWVFFLLWAGLLLAARHAQARRISLLLALVTLLSIVVVTRITPFSNLRYVMVTVPPTLLGVLTLLPCVVKKQAARLSICGALLAVLAAQDVRTVDPLPRAYFGTFSVGSHDMLAMLGQQCPSRLYGRDQLVYNLEYLKFAQASAEVVRIIRPDPRSVIVAPETSLWYMWPTIRPDTLKPSFQWGLNPQYVTVESLLAQPALPPIAYIVKFPFCNCEGYFEPLLELYRKRTSILRDDGGVRTEIIRLADPVR